MARLIWLLFMLAAICLVAAGVSWVAAYVSVANLLGSPPPDMGTQTTAFLWDGVTQLPGHPRAWSFSYGPTRIPGAPNVRIYVSPTGHVLRTEPNDLAVRTKKISR